MYPRCGRLPTNGPFRAWPTFRRVDLPSGVIYAHRTFPAVSGIYVMDASGQNQTLVTNTELSNTSPAWR